VGGGSDTNCGVGPYGCGTVFKLAVAGGESVVYAFKGGTTDGGYPASGVIADSGGNLYGVTAAGGGTGNCGFKFKPIKGCGTAFEIAAAGGGESILHVFTGRKGAGGYPVFGLIQNKAGKFFGATTSGGVIGCSSGAGSLNCGTVFDMNLKK
jgi:uncharacterized repeat protein (TIGR03803 family)